MVPESLSMRLGLLLLLLADLNLSRKPFVYVVELVFIETSWFVLKQSVP